MDSDSHAPGNSEAGAANRHGGEGCAIAAGVGLVLLVVLAMSLTAPSLVRLGKKGELVIAMQNGKSMMLALNEPLDGKAVVLCLDTSTRMLAIRPDTHQVMVTGGKMLLESGIGTLWGTEIQPVIKPPQTPPQWVPVNRGRRWLQWGGAILALIALRVILRKWRRRKAANSVG